MRIRPSISVSLPIVSVSDDESGFCEFYIGTVYKGLRLSYDSTSSTPYKTKGSVVTNCINLSTHIKR